MKILITGASRGIGLAEAQLFDQRGDELFLVARSKQSFRDAALKKLHLYGFDLLNPASADQFAEELGQVTDMLDVFINNAGGFILKRFERMTVGEINQQVDLNLRIHILLTQKLLSFLLKSANPHIVFMSSMAAKAPVVGESVYSAAKAGITNFSTALRNEYKGKIKVSTVHSWGVNVPGVLRMTRHS